MPKPSELLARLEDWAMDKLGGRTISLIKKAKKNIPLLIIGGYLYGMVVNSVHLGIETVFGSEPVESMWIFNPLKNLAAVFSPTSLAIAGVGVLFYCLATKKGYRWLSGNKFTRDPRGFDILADGTHGTSGFMSDKEMKEVISFDRIEDADETVIGKYSKNGDKPKYATIKDDGEYKNHAHSIIIGSTGSGKTQGYIIPFLLQAVKRGESVILVDPKGELYEKTSEYVRQEGGYVTKIFNLLDTENSDAWNSFDDIESDAGLVDAIAETIIKNTSNISERQDFWEKAERNLLIALTHYVQSQKIPGTNELLPIEQRSLAAIYRMLSNETFSDLENRMALLPKDHPAKAPYGIFKLANRQIWGNVAIGLGNRLSVFQNSVIDKITSYNDIDLTLPGRQPCIYYCAISAQDSKYEFLSSLFFSCLFTRLSDYARRNGVNGRLPVRVNFLLEEFCNIGKLIDFKKQLALLRGYNIFCQMAVQSIPMLSDRYEHNEWEEIISHADTMLCMGANDLKTASYISDKCGKVTIRVENNQMPVTPLFSLSNNGARMYSQTKSNTQRALMQPDEILRMDNRKVLAFVRGHKPLMLDKVKPSEFPVFEKLTYTKITDYVPAWRRAPAPEQPEPAKQNTAKVKQSKADQYRQTRIPEFQDGAPDGEPASTAPTSTELPFWFAQNSYTVVEQQEISDTPDTPKGDYGNLDTIEISPDDMLKL